MHRSLRFPRCVALVLAAGPLACGGPEPAPSSPAPPVSTAPVEDAAAEPVRILPLGVSITQADAAHDSYRRPLWHALAAEGAAVDFVGSERDHHGGPPPHDEFDRDHEGHWGWRADEILAELDDWLAASRPRIALVHLGSNDVFQGQPNEETLAELEAIVERLRRADPKVRVLLARILPVADARRNEAIRDLNDGIGRLAERLSTEASPVVAVDHFTGFDPRELTYDGVHPNERGERVMAERWLGALRPFLAEAP